MAKNGSAKTRASREDSIKTEPVNLVSSGTGLAERGRQLLESRLAWVRSHSGPLFKLA